MRFLAQLDFKWVPSMRVDSLEVQLARDQEDDVLEGGEVPEAPRAACGSLEQPLMASRKLLV
jgi:hypothetical protein